jgi:hypothetical protein
VLLGCTRCSSLLGSDVSLLVICHQLRLFLSTLSKLEPVWIHGKLDWPGRFLGTVVFPALEGVLPDWTLFRLVFFKFTFVIPVSPGKPLQ